MKKMIAVICFMLATLPLALAQDKADGRLIVKPGLPAGVTPGSIASGAPAVAPAGVTSIPAGAAAAGTQEAPAAKKPAKVAAKPAAKPAKAKKVPTEKQKAQQAKMKSCAKEASDKKLKGDERKKFMSGCMGAKPAAEPGKAPAKK